ncbi:sigma-70 family RNA polymerase sigma factor [Streptomyces sp. NPDC088727]|uniref:sigma-70 family RNA polymerase sigma factor n=1 Tax=Streptomyces sp. NPDC088727 TaxID=3365875 RepID=UPI00382C0512
MTTDPPLPPNRAAHKRPGRKLGPISQNVGPTHHAWLTPVRTAYLCSGLTLRELSVRVNLATSKLSELLRGTGLYPRWEIVLSLATELKIPDWPLHRLWRQAAFEAHKSREWTARSGEQALTISHTAPPLDLKAFRELMENHYVRYAQCFLNDDQRDTAVQDTFDILWLRWNEALASSDARHFAWWVFRTTVMARTPHPDGHPELAEAAFDTVALQALTSQTERMQQITESIMLFKAISRLPAHQLDVMVLRRLCGITPRASSALMGVPLATVRSDERHAARVLESLLCPRNRTEGNPA